VAAEGALWARFDEGRQDKGMNCHLLCFAVPVESAGVVPTVGSDPHLGQYSAFDRFRCAPPTSGFSVQGSHPAVVGHFVSGVPRHR